jgi:hypothetical protein
MTKRNVLNDGTILTGAMDTPSLRERGIRVSAKRITAAIVVVLMGVLMESLCQTPARVLTIQSPKVEAHALFGWRVDAYGDWAVVSAPFEDVGKEISAGRVYLYSAKQGWRLAQLIEAPDPQAVRTFGMSVALSDNVLAIGAPGDHDGSLMSGAVYVYTRTPSTWVLSAKLLSPDPVFGGRFGSAVAVSPHVLAVSAPRATGSAEKSGAAYVFERDTSSWRFVKKLRSETAVPDEAFGTLVRLLDDSTIAIGRSMTDPFEGRKEVVSIFSRRMGTWSQADLAIPSGGRFDLFGASLASNDRFLAVGVPGRSVDGIRSGGVVVYDRKTTLPLWNIVNPTPSELVYFGGSLFIHGDRLYVGCVQSKAESRVPMGMVAGYNISTIESKPTQWYPLEDQEGLPHSCPQVSATDSVVIVSSPFCDIEGIVDAGMVRFFKVSGVVGVDEPTVPLEYALAQNYPNPFNSMTNINFSLKAPGRIRLDLFNILGQRVATLVNEEMKEGRHTTTFDARNYASGVYFYRLTVNEFLAIKKMLLLK